MRILLACFIALGTFAAQAAPDSVLQASTRAHKILIYRGAGGCTSCAAAAARAVRGLHMKVQYVSADNVTPAVFKNAVMWVQPAGNAISAAGALGTQRMGMIRDFVKQGGGYLGFCAGAFLADSTVDDSGAIHGIGLLPFPTADYVVNQTTNIDMVWLNWRGAHRHVFFNGGATFEIGSSKRLVDVIATYSVDAKPAVIRMAYGRGRVVLSGAHPEAPQAWKDANNVKDQDGSDLDLANQLAKFALGK
jgi:glutamine amidotransferase-like uncharacterized protein